MVTASRDVLSIALKHGGVLKGVAEVLKALELGKSKVKMVFLAEDCDNNDYKNVVSTLARQQGVPCVEIPTWVELKDFCKLGLASQVITRIAEEKGKAPKIKPRCSSCAVIVNIILKKFSNLKIFIIILNTLLKLIFIY